MPISGGYVTHDQMEELQKALKEFNRKSSRQANAMLWLTVVIAFLTFVQIAVGGAQVLIALRVIGGGGCPLVDPV